MRVLGIEGTAWAASAAVFDRTTGEIEMETIPYAPPAGGIHPREAAEHMSEAIPTVVESVLLEQGAIDAVAFSQGPGLGPCLRIVATAARTIAQRLEVPLVGVNHMVAHLEIGRIQSGFDDPICLNASGANAHVLGYQDGRYRMLGETMDTGIGNAIDKFTRALEWSHPGGPKVESRAVDGDYHPLPYVVKGMDFSFAGITSAAIDAVEAGVPVEDVCCGIQETMFGMLTEVSERALSLTGRDELIIGGGVGQNSRLQVMLETMCADRGATFFAPERRFLGDNAGMIAVLGAEMFASGETITLEESQVCADYRPDTVDITWYTNPDAFRPPTNGVQHGAEAEVTVKSDRIVKIRRPKRYRHPDLDARLRSTRTATEARLTSVARQHGVSTPVILDIDLATARLAIERVGGADLRDAITVERAHEVGTMLARLHAAGIVHGDPTPRNVRVADDRLYLIDFGLGYHSDHTEDFAMDLHIFNESVSGTASHADQYQQACESGYRTAGDPAVITRLREIERRGRYQARAEG